MGLSHLIHKLFVFASASVLLVGAVSSQQQKYIEFEVVVPHESIGEPTVEYIDTGNTFRSTGDEGSDVTFKLYSSNNQLLSEKSYSTDYNLFVSSPYRQNSSGEAIQEAPNGYMNYNVAFNQSSEMSSLHVNGSGIRNRSFDIENLTRSQGMNLSVWDNSTGKSSSSGITEIDPVPISLIVVAALAVLSVLLIRRRKSKQTSYSVEGFN